MLCLDVCKSVAEPQRDLGTQASPSCMRSPDPRGTTQSLVDDARTSTLPPATDLRAATLSHDDEAGAGCALGDVGTSASPRVIDVDLISARPSGMEEDLIRDQAQIEQAPHGLGTSSAQVPDSSLTSPRLPRREID
jgi:hypothetical protein